MDAEKEEGCQAQGQEVLEFGSVVTGGGEKVLTVVIAGQIEGHQLLPPPAKATRYEHVLPKLVQAEESEEVAP